MKKIKKILSSPWFSIVTLVAAIGLLAFSTIGGARAALTYYSDTYHSQVETKDIGVTLVENDLDIACRDYVKEKADGTWNEKAGILLENMIPEGEKVVLGQHYPEVLCVKNSGTIDNYVRVTIYKYWVDEQGNKTREIDPEAIDLRLVNLAGDEAGEQCWIEDKSAKTKERTVLYYNRLLASTQGSTSGMDAVTPPFADALKINLDMEKYAKTEKTENGVIVTTNQINGYRFIVEVTVDAVQNHNAEAAIQSAWGKRVSIQNKSLSLFEEE